MNKFATMAVLCAYAAVPAAAMAVSLDVGANGIIYAGDAVQIEAAAEASTGTQTPGHDDFGMESAPGQEAAVSVEGTAEPMLMNSEADLQAYGEFVAEKHQSIEEVQADISGSVRVEYRQPAKLLGVINVGLDAAVEVNPEAQVSVQLPWYHFLFATDSAAVEAQVQAAVNAAVNAHRVRTDLDGQASTSAHVLNGARMVNVVAASIEGTVQASAQ